jgi:RNase P/RNase MRP subunit p29
MITIKCSGTEWRLLFGGVVLFTCFSLTSFAQVQTTKSETRGPATRSVTVERGEIVYISGSTVVIRMEDGTLKEFDNVPESTTFMVDGNPVNINTAKVGMKLEKQIVTTTTPRVVTTVETVTGKVWRVSAPNSVFLTLENGQSQQFKVPKGQKFMVDGQETDVWHLRKGMKVTAQRITEVPETVVAREVKMTGSAPPPPAPPQPDVPILIAVITPVPQPVETAVAGPAPAPPAKLPETASNVPLIGLLGMLLCAPWLVSKAIRKIGSRRMNWQS